jgi:hypothetical protein
MTLISIYIYIYGPIHVEGSNELNFALFQMQMGWFCFLISCLLTENSTQKLAACFDNSRSLYMLKTSPVSSVPPSTCSFEIRLPSYAM